MDLWDSSYEPVTYFDFLYSQWSLPALTHSKPSRWPRIRVGLYIPECEEAELMAVAGRWMHAYWAGKWTQISGCGTGRPETL